jgi:hypothetical protein
VAEGIKENSGMVNLTSNDIKQAYATCRENNA